VVRRSGTPPRVDNGAFVGFTVRCSRLASGFGRLAKSTGRRVVIPKPAPAGRLKNWEPFLKWARDAADTSTAS